MTEPIVSVEYRCPICGERFSGPNLQTDWGAHTEICTQEHADSMCANIGRWAYVGPSKSYGITHRYIGKIVGVSLLNSSYRMDGVHINDNGYCDDFESGRFGKNLVQILTEEEAESKVVELRELAHRYLDITFDKRLSALKEEVE